MQSAGALGRTRVSPAGHRLLQVGVSSDWKAHTLPSMITHRADRLGNREMAHARGGAPIAQCRCLWTGYQAVQVLDSLPHRVRQGVPQRSPLHSVIGLRQRTWLRSASRQLRVRRQG